MSKQMNITLTDEKYDFLKRNGLYGIRCVDYTIRKYKEEMGTSLEKDIESKIYELKFDINKHEQEIDKNKLLLKELESELDKIKRIPNVKVEAIEKEMDLLYDEFISSSMGDKSFDTSLESFFDWKESDIGVIAMDYHISIDEVKSIYEKFYYNTDIDDIGFVDQVIES